MFAGKDRDSAVLRADNDRAFAASSALVADALASGEIESEDSDRVAMGLLATLQGLAAVITSGMIGTRGPQTVVAATIATLIHGLRHS
jgi:hypothetical protein